MWVTDMKARNWELKEIEIWSKYPQITAMDCDVLLQYGRELEMPALKQFLFDKWNHNSNIAGKFIAYNWARDLTPKWMFKPNN